MIVICNNCNGTGEHNHFPEYSKAKCESCGGSGEIITFFFEIDHVRKYKCFNEIDVFLNWFKDSDKKRREFNCELPVNVVLNFHSCHQMNNEQLSEYILNHFDHETTSFNLPDILTNEQVQELYFNNNTNQTTYEKRNDNH